MKNKIVTIDEMIKIAELYRTEGKKLVSTSGCFDILHEGHVLYLQDAKAYGDVLLVMLNSDESVKKLKGNDRPIVDQCGRAVVIAALECVDYVCIFDDLTPCNLISEIKPEVVIKGGDYAGKHIPEQDTVAEYGGRVEYSLIVEGRSTTNIIDKISSILKKEHEV